MKLREVSLAMQIKAMQRAAAPITVEYNIDTVADVKCFNRAVLDLLMQRKLGHHDLIAINGVVRNQLQILIPRPGVTQTVNVQTVVKTEANWRKLFEETPEEERLVVARFIKRLAERESSPNPS